jgi:GNAT superfamily N-acetyltransferase
MSMVVYRLAENRDAPRLADLRWGLRTDDAPASDAAAKARFVQEFVAWMGNRPDENLVHWVAEQDDGLIGVISVRIIHKLPSPEDADGRFGYLTNSYVLPEHRNSGVGTALLAAVKDWALSQKLELLVVWPSERAYPFYERGGYRRHPDPVVLKLQQG